MAEIESALPQLYLNEGGYSNVTGDTGGETYRGISRNNFPYWDGWEIVDKHKPLHNEQIIKDEELDRLVKQFYLDTFWNPQKLGEIKAQSVANKLLDMTVNMGKYRGAILLQQALVNKCRCAINTDGKIGKETINAVNQQAAGYLLTLLRDRSVQFYENLAAEHPSKEKFLNGWLRRAEQ